MGQKFVEGHDGRAQLACGYRYLNADFLANCRTVTAGGEFPDESDACRFQTDSPSDRFFGLVFYSSFPAPVCKEVGIDQLRG